MSSPSVSLSKAKSQSWEDLGSLSPPSRPSLSPAPTPTRPRVDSISIHPNSPTLASSDQVPLHPASWPTASPPLSDAAHSTGSQGKGRASVGKSFGVPLDETPLEDTQSDPANSTSTSACLSKTPSSSSTSSAHSDDSSATLPFDLATTSPTSAEEAPSESTASGTTTPTRPSFSNEIRNLFCSSASPNGGVDAQTSYDLRAAAAKDENDDEQGRDELPEILVPNVFVESIHDLSLLLSTLSSSGPSTLSPTLLKHTKRQLVHQFEACLSHLVTVAAATAGLEPAAARETIASVLEESRAMTTATTTTRKDGVQEQGQTEFNKALRGFYEAFKKKDPVGPGRQCEVEERQESAAAMPTSRDPPQPPTTPKRATTGSSTATFGIGTSKPSPTHLPTASFSPPAPGSAFSKFASPPGQPATVFAPLPATVAPVAGVHPTLKAALKAVAAVPPVDPFAASALSANAIASAAVKPLSTSTSTPLVARATALAARAAALAEMSPYHRSTVTQPGMSKTESRPSVQPPCPTSAEVSADSDAETSPPSAPAPAPAPRASSSTLPSTLPSNSIASGSSTSTNTSAPHPGVVPTPSLFGSTTSTSHPASTTSLFGNTSNSPYQNSPAPYPAPAPGVRYFGATPSYPTPLPAHYSRNPGSLSAPAPTTTTNTAPTLFGSNRGFSFGDRPSPFGAAPPAYASYASLFATAPTPSRAAASQTPPVVTQSTQASTSTTSTPDSGPQRLEVNVSGTGTWNVAFEYGVGGVKVNVTQPQAAAPPAVAPVFPTPPAPTFVPAPYPHPSYGLAPTPAPAPAPAPTTVPAATTTTQPYDEPAASFAAHVSRHYAEIQRANSNADHMFSPLSFSLAGGAVNISTGVPAPAPNSTGGESFQSITAYPPYDQFSAEELRVKHYAENAAAAASIVRTLPQTGPSVAPTSAEASTSGEKKDTGKASADVGSSSA